ncbi:unnamed protein product [Sphenostylis stenocarpa]|uniref:Uncharacterized protein n=1 Tax=Sphenostylis stenocarpa TaxID=92480 RepID=A0AA86SYC2_9FABA|nr:unnamed protein product [Sphenostylis stenocarpa]
MNSSRYSLFRVTILLAFFIIASDLCMMKTEARGPIYRMPCDSDKECQIGCHNPNCGCASQCIEHVCQCPHPASTVTDVITPPAPPSN